MTQRRLPTPRLRHARVGQTVVLLGDDKPRRIVEANRAFAFFDDGVVAHLGYPVDPSDFEFGEGGWRIQEDDHGP